VAEHARLSATGAEIMENARRWIAAT
jgi:hypothetical protein